MEGIGSPHNSATITLRGNENNKLVSCNGGMEWEVVTEVPQTEPLPSKRTSLQEDLENVEVTRKRKAKRVTSKEEKYFRLMWDLMSTGDQFRSKVSEE